MSAALTWSMHKSVQCLMPTVGVLSKSPGVPLLEGPCKPKAVPALCQLSTTVTSLPGGGTMHCSAPFMAAVFMAAHASSHAVALAKDIQHYTGCHPGLPKQLRVLPLRGWGASPARRHLVTATSHGLSNKIFSSV